MPTALIFAGEVFQLIFHGTTIVGIARNDAAPITTITFGLHTADPGDLQTNFAAAYTGYTIVTLSRTSPAFTVTGRVVELLTTLSFPAATASAGETLDFCSFGSGVADKVLFSAAITPAIIIPVGGNNSIPQLQGLDSPPATKLTLI